jgi:flagellar basal-body rod modification protein FlgD
MAVSGVGSSTSVVSGTSATNSATDSQAIQDRFMTLLVEQLKNQDPLNPMENAQITSQMSQISTVTGIQQLNATMTSLAASMATQQASQAIDLIGKSVSVPGNSMELKSLDGKLSGSINVALESAADKVNITISDPQGHAIRQLELTNVSAGLQAVSWDGLSDTGVVQPAGSYTAKVDAMSGDNKVAVQALEWGRVASIERDASGSAWSLVVNRSSGASSRVALSDVRSVVGQ